MEIDALNRGLVDPATIAWWREPLARRDWKSYLWRVPRPGRLAALLEIIPKLTDPEYWQLLGTIWTDTEYPNVNRALWLGLFTSKRDNRDPVMDAEGHAAVDRLPDPVRIYRGAQLRYARGMSWTTDPDTAAWFAHRFQHRRGEVFTTTLAKRKILAYFDDRKEREVLIDPRRIRVAVLDWSEEQLNEAIARAERPLAEERRKPSATTRPRP